MNIQHQKSLNPMLVLLVRLYRCRDSESGFIVFLVAAMAVLLGFLWLAYALMNKVDSSGAVATEKINTGFYAAEYGLNLRAKEIRSKFEGYNRPSGTSPSNWEACTDADSSNNGSADFACQNQQVQNQNVATFVRDLSPGTPIQTTIPTGEPFAGLNAQEYRYNVVSVARDGQNLPTAILEMQFKNRLVPLFQFVVFYNNDADFTYPPNMTLNGPVHSNGDLYLNAGSSSTLTFNDAISVAGDLYRGQKTPNDCGQTVRIRNASNVYQNLLCSGSSRTRYRSDTTNPSNISTWGGRIQIGIPRLAVPSPDDLDPVAGKTYWDKADLRIVLNVSNDASNTQSGTRVDSIEVQNQNGTQNTAATTALLSCSALNAAGTAISTTLSSTAFSTFVNLPVGSIANFTAQDVLVVGDDYDSNVVAVSPTGSQLTIRRRLGSTQTAGATVRKAIVSSSDTFYNYREKYNSSNSPVTGGFAGRFIRMLNVDVQQLLNCAQNQSNLLGGKTLDDNTDGGLVWFLTVRGPNSTPTVTQPTTTQTLGGSNPNNYGIRLYNGASLSSTVAGAPPIRGLTIISDQAVYIQGNYNSINKRPAAILADTINVLSNRWQNDDFNSTIYNTTGANINLPANSSTTGKLLCQPSATGANDCGNGAATVTQINNQTHRPAATETTINAAFLAGTQITGGGNGASTQGNGLETGGVNNYPRFHEYWTNVNFNYRGSFVSLNQPRRNSSAFCGSFNPVNCNIYTPPFRNWDFDTDFNNAANLPPLTPQAVYLRQEVFMRTFDRASTHWLPSPLASLRPWSFLGVLPATSLNTW